MRKKYVLTAAVLAAALAVSGGCAGRKDAGEAESVQSWEADESNVAAILKELTARPRPGGSEGETVAAAYIQNYMEELGYETSLMPFTQEGSWSDEQPVSGTNVEAVRPADGQGTGGKADIVIIGAHHDGQPASQAAVDDAAGVAVLLETARLVKDIPSNIELRFVSFSGEENGRVGSRYYVEQLTQEEKDRIIGQIELDEIGYVNSSFLRLETVDGKPTFLGNLLMSTAEQYELPVAGEFAAGNMSDQNSFVSGGIPAVELTIGETAYENHSTLDTLDIVDAEECARAAAVVADALSQLSRSTDSYEKSSRAINPNPGFQVLRETELWFGMSRNFVENMMGQSGEEVSSGTDEFGDKSEIYRYPVRWFGMDEPMMTEYRYRNGFLEEIDIPYREATGEDAETAAARIGEALGEPEISEAEYGANYEWSDPLYHKYYILTPTEDGYILYVIDDNFGRVMGSAYDLEQALTEEGGITDSVPADAPERDRKLLELAAKIVCPEDRSMVRLQIFSDGYHNATGVTSAVEYDDNSRMEYCLDEDDAFMEGGTEWRDEHKTQRAAVHEYGHVISLNSAQVDIGVEQQDESMPSLFYSKEHFAENAYLWAYYEQFWKELSVNSGTDRYREAPEEFVSEYAAGNISEDFAESFAMFVLVKKPDGDTVADRKVRFFYDYEELVSRRQYIRGNLGLDD